MRRLHGDGHATGGADASGGGERSGQRGLLDEALLLGGGRVWFFFELEVYVCTVNVQLPERFASLQRVERPRLWQQTFSCIRGSVPQCA